MTDSHHTPRLASTRCREMVTIDHSGTRVLVANEGDGREYFGSPDNDEEGASAVCFTDETRVGDVNLAPRFPRPANISGDLQHDENLGRMLQLYQVDCFRRAIPTSPRKPVMKR